MIYTKIKEMCVIIFCTTICLCACGNHDVDKTDVIQDMNDYKSSVEKMEIGIDEISCDDCDKEELKDTYREEVYFSNLEIRCVGDSIVAAYGSNGYGLAEMLKDRKNITNFSNVAISGSGITEDFPGCNILTQFDEYYSEKSTKGKNTLYIVDGGGNELLSLLVGDPYGITFGKSDSAKKDVYAAQQLLIEKIAMCSPGATVIWIIPSINIENFWEIFAPDYYQSEIERITEYCVNNNLNLIFADCTKLSEEDFIDHIHPSKEGYEKLTDMVEDRIYSVYYDSVVNN